MTFDCTICDLQYRSKSGYYKHFRIKHKIIISERNVHNIYKCNNCNKKFSNKKHLIRHLKDETQIMRYVNYKQKCSFDNCNETFRLIKMYKIHLQIVHNVAITHDTLKFNTMEEFSEWKSDIEEKQFCQFVKKTSNKKSGGRFYIYYYCHRSFDPRISTNNRKKKSKTGGSVKIGHVCPSTMVVCIDSSEITVNYCSTHLWHSNEIKKQRLPVEERKKIAEDETKKWWNNIKDSRVRNKRKSDKLLIGVPINQIMNEIHSSRDGMEIKRIHLIQKKDIYNIKRDFKIQSAIKTCNKCLICHSYKCTCVDNITDNNISNRIHECIEVSSPAPTSNSVQTNIPITIPAYSNKLVIDNNELVEVIYENQSDDNDDDADDNSKLATVDNVYYCDDPVNPDQYYYNYEIENKMKIMPNAYKNSNLNVEDLKNVLNYCDKILEICTTSTDIR